MSKKTILWIIALFLLALPLSYAFEMSTGSYSVDSSHSGSSGNDITTASYVSRDTVTYEQGSNGEASTASYTFNSGWFTLIKKAVGNVTINSVECSNDTINYYPCSDMKSNMTVTHIKVDCTSLGNISDVRFTLYNSQDNVNYINNLPYTSKAGNYYILNSSYLIKDSGNWTLSVVCISSVGSDTSQTAWQVAWGWLKINLVQPVIDTSVQLFKIFTFQSKVTCEGGECGTLNVTLDPEHCAQKEVCRNDTIKVCNDSVQNVCEDSCHDVCMPGMINKTVQKCVNETKIDCPEKCYQECRQSCTTDETNKTACSDNCTEVCKQGL